MSLTKIAVKFAAALPDIESFDRFLFIGPHPDDIEIGAGATAAKLAKAGKKLCFLVCMDGRFGNDGVPPETTAKELIEIRKNEALKSAALIGVDDVRFLGFCDGGLYDTGLLFREIMKTIGSFQPDIIFAPDPCVDSECHADHLNVGEAARKAAYFSPYSSIAAEYGASSANIHGLAYYMTAKANSFVKVSAENFRVQLSSVFDCHLSQFPKGSESRKAIELYLRIRSADFGLRRLCKHAEGFRVLGITHMHCLPEAGI